MIVPSVVGIDPIIFIYICAKVTVQEQPNINYIKILFTFFTFHELHTFFLHSEDKGLFHFLLLHAFSAGVCQSNC